MLAAEIDQRRVLLGRELADDDLAVAVAKGHGDRGPGAASELRARTHAAMLDHRRVISSRFGHTNRSERGLRLDEDAGPDRDERIELLGVLHVHPDAAVGGGRADR